VGAVVDDVGEKQQIPPRSIRRKQRQALALYPEAVEASSTSRCRSPTYQRREYSRRTSSSAKSRASFSTG
jgi:hypothetical protein